MNLHVLIFMLLNISGAQDVRTVSQVSVQEGKSIIIPCWYNPIYVNYVKYLSVGHSWVASKYVVSSDGESHHKTISVSDNKTLNILTVKMRSVRRSQTGTYWCGINLPGCDVGEAFHLSVTTGHSGLYVWNQMLMGFVADGASVKVRYCSGLMIVTMSKLKKDNTGWYWCSARKLQMPVHITVSTRRETVTTTTTQMISDQPTSSSTVQLLGTFSSAPQNENQSETTVLLWLIILGIIFVLIVIFSCTAVILCKKKQKLPRNSTLRKQSNTDSEETHFGMCERQLTQTSQTASEDYELIYATVSFREH